MMNSMTKKISAACLAVLISSSVMCTAYAGAESRTDNTSLFAAAYASAEESKTKVMSVPVVSLSSGAPLQPVKDAFNTAFGESVIVTEKADGTMTARIKNHHMGIDFSSWGMGVFDANVSYVKDAVVLSEKQEQYSNVKGSLANTPEMTDITVPDEFEIELDLDEKNSQKITIGVDFMAGMYNQSPDEYSTVVTLTLDMENAIDLTELNALIEECSSLDTSVYTDDSVEAFEQALEEAKAVAEAPESAEQVSETLEALKAAKKALTKKTSFIDDLADGVYEIPVALWNATEDKESMAASAVEATAKIVVENGDMTVYLYTKPMTVWSITASLQEMKIEQSDGSWVEAVVVDRSDDDNPICFSFTLDILSEYVNAKVNPHIEAMGNQDIAARLKFDLAEITKVSTDTPDDSSAPDDSSTPDDSSIPSDSSKPDDSSVPGNSDEIDIDNLADGVYEIPVALWHAAEDRASMAAESFNGTARIVVENGKMTVYIYTKPMTFGAITASLQEMKIELSDGSWVEAVVADRSDDGNPICFSFELDKLSDFVNAKVNPHVEMMGNQDLDARLKFDISAIKKISDEADNGDILIPPEETKPSTDNSSDNNDTSSNDNNGSGSSSASSNKSDANPSTGAATSAAGLSVLLGAALIVVKKKK